jgi:hypothetical protein
VGLTACRRRKLEENFSRKMGSDKTIERSGPSWGMILKCILKEE